MPSGRRFHHQRRIPLLVLEICMVSLLRHSSDIKKSSKFHELLLKIDRYIGSIKGIGELMIYDTSVRIGSFLGLKPEYVYLHAGTKVGAQYLGVQNGNCFIEKNSLPKEFRELEPYAIEDILCIFKDDLKSLWDSNLKGSSKRHCYIHSNAKNSACAHTPLRS